MSKAFDLKPFFDAWPYDPETNARVIRGADGREIMQVRQPLGLEQYELDGRPDGKRPHGKDSLLVFHRNRLIEAQATGAEAAAVLTHRQCHELFDEGVLYYYRYLNLFQLKDWPRVIRDTARNLELFDLVREHAESEDDKFHLDQWRPYVLRMHAVARVMIEVDKDNYEEALTIVRTTLAAIESLDENENPTFAFERDRSLAALRELADHIDQTRPLSARERLERDLERAVDDQEFERAAEIRDRIRELEE